MSAEEQRWTRIENALAMLSEHQANAVVREEQADKEMAEIRTAQKASDERLDRHIEFVVKAMDRTEQQIARTAAAQEVTELRLQALINKVDEVDDRVTKLERKKS